jgi:hypothetical protein
LSYLAQSIIILALLTFPAYSTVSGLNSRRLFSKLNWEDPTKYQTEEDRAIIRKLIENYITDKRTIIL